jgi:hypothetical protein
MGAKIGSARDALPAEPGAPTGNDSCQDGNLQRLTRIPKQKKAELKLRSILCKMNSVFGLPIDIVGISEMQKYGLT